MQASVPDLQEPVSDAGGQQWLLSAAGHARRTLSETAQNRISPPLLPQSQVNAGTRNDPVSCSVVRLTV